MVYKSTIGPADDQVLDFIWNNNIIPNKNNLLIFCSKKDFKLYSSDLKKKFESDIISLKANYMLEVVE